MGYFIKQIIADITYNESTNSLEYDNGTSTVEVGKSGSVDPVIDTITTAGASAGPYTTSVDYGPAGDYDFDPNNPEYLIVMIEGIHQEPTTAYTVSNFDITFTSIPPDGLTVTVIHGAYSTFVPNTNIF
jgi:hypothetical protein